MKKTSLQRSLPLRFVLTATTLLGLLHAYIGLRILPALALTPVQTGAAIALLVFSTLLVPAGLLARQLRGRLHRRLDDLLTWSGLIATGFASSLLVLTVLRELALLPALVLLDFSRYAYLAHLSAWSVVVLAFAFTLIGLYNARRTPRLVEIDVPLPDLPRELHGFSIAQISDVHVGPTIKRGFLERIVERVNSLEAHLVAITGDLVDGSVADLAGHTEVLADLRSTYGTYFVTGNHEYYSGAEAWVRELRRLGIVVLQNEHVVLKHGGASILVAGVTDYSAHRFDAHRRSDPQRALAGAPQDVAAKVLLAHQPRSAPAAAAAGFHLQLSGHTHGGQFFPWNLFVRLQQPFTAGLHKLKELWVYTSRGSGYWGPPKRLGAPAEITLLRLLPLLDPAPAQAAGPLTQAGMRTPSMPPCPA